MKTYTLNVAFLVTVPLTVGLAATGCISWWTLLAVWVPHLSVALTFQKKRSTR